MAQGHQTPRRVWFSPTPYPKSPLDGGALMHIKPREGETLTVGMDLARLLKLQEVVAHVISIVVTRSIQGVIAEAEAVNPITEEEIQAAAKLLDSEWQELSQSNNEKKDEEE